MYPKVWTDLNDAYLEIFGEHPEVPAIYLDPRVVSIRRRSTSDGGGSARRLTRRP